MFMRIFNLAALALLVSFGAQASGEKPQACLAKDQGLTAAEHRSVMSKYGINCAKVYYSLLAEDNLKDPYSWIKREYLDYDIDVTMVLIINPREGEGNLPELITSGKYDDKIRILAKKVKQSGKQIKLNHMHELDGSWYPWQFYYKDNSLEESLNAYIHIAEIFREVEAPVIMEVNLNRRDGKSNSPLGEAEKYLGILDPHVDAYAISTYNRCGLNQNYAEERSFAEEFRPAYERLSGFTEKPINIAEVSTSGLCSDGRKIPWFEAMYISIAEEFSRVEEITFFFGQLKPGQSGSAVNVDWGIVLDEEREMFRSLVTENTSSSAVEITIEQTGSAIPPAAEPKLRLGFSSDEWDWNYRYWVSLFGELNDEPIPDYGQTGLWLQSITEVSYDQSKGRFRHGVFGQLRGSASNNCEPRYWQCVLGLGAGYRLEFRRSSENHYNTVQLRASIRYDQPYNDDTFESSREGDTYGYVGVVAFGGGKL